MAGFMGGLGFGQLVQQIMARRGSFMPPQAGGGTPLKQMFRQRPPAVAGQGFMQPMAQTLGGMASRRKPAAAPMGAPQPTQQPALAPSAAPAVMGQSTFGTMPAVGGMQMGGPARGLRRRKGWM